MILINDKTFTRQQTLVPPVVGTASHVTRIVAWGVAIATVAVTPTPTPTSTVPCSVVAAVVCAIRLAVARCITHVTTTTISLLTVIPGAK